MGSDREPAMYETTLLPFIESLSCRTLWKPKKVEYSNLKRPKHAMNASEQNFIYFTFEKMTIKYKINFGPKKIMSL